MFLGSRARLARHRYLTRHWWLRRVVFWAGAVAVCLTALAFASLATRADALFHHVVDRIPWLALVITPAGMALGVWLTRRFFPGAQGSGIPQVIAAGEMQDAVGIRHVLSLRVALGKVAITLLGLASGASIGREGPTVQIGASLMRALGQAVEQTTVADLRALVLAGGAAGVAAAFNTPLGGVVFAIEELSHSFEQRTSGTVLTAVIIAGICTTAIVGNSSYFGHTDATLPIGIGWAAVVACAVCGGLCGGLFSRLLLAASDGLPGLAGRLAAHRPVMLAGFFGLILAGIGIATGGSTYGTGYAQATAMVAGHYQLPLDFFAAKMAATVVSYASGIPGGIFAPSLATGAGLGRCIAYMLPAAPAGAVVLLGMAAYFAGVVQAPITAAVIVMEMTDNQEMTIPLMATSFLAYGVSRLVCRRALYGTLAKRFLRAVEGPASVVSGVAMDDVEDMHL
jgi:H+/Cl- antiporter ClcA